MSRPLLEISDLSVAFDTDEGSVEVLHRISFSLQKNELLGIVGESGSGKSVCSLAITGLLPLPSAKITSGRILFDGMDLAKSKADTFYKIRGKRIAMIFQEPISALNPVHTIGKQLAEVFQLHFPSMDETAIRNASVELLEKVNIHNPASKLGAYPHELSGGLCQRVMIAMALACQPEILIADEPTTALDVTTQKQILTLLKKLQPEFGMSVMFITHDLGVIAELCDRAIVMQDGYIREQAPVEKLFSDPQHPYTQKLLSAIIPIDAPPKTTLKKTSTIEPLHEAGQHHPLSNNSSESSGEPLLEVRNLCKYYPVGTGILGRPRAFFTAVDDASFSIFRGETLGLVGESGCGKSTLGRALLYLDPPDQGEVIFDGVNLASLKSAEMRKLRKRIQIIFQDTNESLNPRHTVATLLEEPYLIHGMGDRVSRAKWIRGLLDKVELPANSLNRYPHEFSGGQRQRIGIARAIALQPDFIVCDEPVSALDVSTQAQVINLMLQLQQELSLTLLFISHDLSVVKHVSDRVMVMKGGHIIEINTASEIYTHPKESYTQELISAIPRAGTRL